MKKTDALIHITLDKDLRDRIASAAKRTHPSLTIVGWSREILRKAVEDFERGQVG